jgi:hypothetical protein
VSSLEQKLSSLKLASFAPAASLTLRFGDEKIPHVGKALRGAIDETFALLGDDAPFWLFGFHPKGAKARVRVEQPKDLRTPGGNAYLDKVLTAFRSLPKAGTRADGLDLVVKDGEKPWGPGGSVAPRRAAIVLGGAATDEPWTCGGVFQVAFPLSHLEDEKKRDAWLALGDALFDSLKATNGWLTPAMWTVPATLSHGGSVHDEAAYTLFGELPQVDLPHFHMGNSWVTLTELKPGPRAGFVSPFWTTWLRGRKTPRAMIEKEPPLDMNEARYEKYRAARGSMPICSLPTADWQYRLRYYLDRFAAPKLAGAVKRMKDEARAIDAKAAREQAMQDKLTALCDKNSFAKAYAYAREKREELGVDWILHNIESLMRAQRADGALDEALARTWLDAVTPEMSAGAHQTATWLANHLGEIDRALAHAQIAVEKNKGEHNFLQRMRQEPQFGKLRRDARYLKLLDATRKT